MLVKEGVVNVTLCWYVTYNSTSMYRGTLLMRRAIGQVDQTAMDVQFLKSTSLHVALVPQAWPKASPKSQRNSHIVTENVKPAIKVTLITSTIPITSIVESKRMLIFVAQGAHHRVSARADISVGAGTPA